MGQLMESIGNILKSTPKVYAAISDEAAALINPKGRHAALIYRTFSSSELTSLFNKLREAGNGFEDAWGMGSGFRSKEVYIPIPFKGRDLTVFEQAVRDKRKLFRGTLDVRPESIGDVLAALIIIKKTRDERQRERLLQRLVDELSDEQRMNLETILLDLESRGILNKGVWNEALKADIRQRLR
jgi:hypothetical protein